jgi:VanZ family protein
MTRKLAFFLVGVLLALLMVGTQIPGLWRSALEASLHSPWPLAKVAHLSIFAAMAFLCTVRPLSWPAWRVLLAALALGLLTEGLQWVVAIDRDASWTDVGIDMAGAAIAVLLARALPGMNGFRKN